MTSQPVRRVMVVKLGDLAGFVLAFGAFAAIRRHHPDAHIVLLTSAPFRDLAAKSGWFDEVWDDGLPNWSHPRDAWHLAHKLRRSGVDMVYDLENTPRTARYRVMMSDVWGNKAPWSRGAAGQSNGSTEHIVEQHARQLAEAGIAAMGRPSLSWLTAGYKGRFGLDSGFVLFAAGGHQRRPADRWPADRFAELARRVAVEGRRPVLVGAASDADINRKIAAASPEALDLTGKTSLFDLAVLAAHADAAIGNVTGPTHLIAAVGCPTVAIFHDRPDQGNNCPRGRLVVLMRNANLAELKVTEVAAALRLR